MTKAEIISKKFYDLDKVNKFPYLTKQFFELLIRIYKENGEPDQFALSTGVLCRSLNSSEKVIIDARKKLEEVGIIIYKNSGTRSPGIYKFAEVKNTGNLYNNNSLNAVPILKNYSPNLPYIYTIAGQPEIYYPFVSNYSNQSNQGNQYNFDFSFLKNVDEITLLVLLPILGIGIGALNELFKKKIDPDELSKYIAIGGITGIIIDIIIYVLCPSNMFKQSNTSSEQQKLSQSANTSDQQTKPAL